MYIHEFEGILLKEIPREGCDGCFFENLCVDGYQGIEQVEAAVGCCSGSYRSDGQDVIYVKVEPGPEEIPIPTMNRPRAI